MFPEADESRSWTLLPDDQGTELEQEDDDIGERKELDQLRREKRFICGHRRSSLTVNRKS